MIRVETMYYLDITQYAFIQFECVLLIVVTHSQSALVILKLKSSKIKHLSDFFPLEVCNPKIAGFKDMPSRKYY